MSNLSYISDTSRLARSIGQLIVVTPTPEGYTPQNGYDNGTESVTTKRKFVFDYEGEQAIDLESETTDHFTETGSVIQDNIVNKPVIISTQAFIGELSTTPPNEAFATLRTASQKLTAIGTYLPQYSATQLSMLNRAEAAFRDLKFIREVAMDKWRSFGKNTSAIITGSETSIQLDQTISQAKNQTKQQETFLLFYGYWSKKTLFTVQTPWGIFKNCSIQSIRSVQEEGNRYVSSFSIKFKVMRFASTDTTEAEEFQFNPADSEVTTKIQGSSIVDKGSISVGENVTSVTDSVF